MLVTHLNDQDEGMDVDLLQGMLVADQTGWLTARECLMMGLENGLFKRRAVDGLVACAVVGEEEANDNPDATVPSLRRAQQEGSADEARSSSSDADVDGSKGEPSRIFVRSGAPSLSSSGPRGRSRRTTGGQ